LLNIAHYCLYKADYKFHLLTNKINPFLLLGRMPLLKRRFEEKGTSLVEVVDEVWGNKHYGFGLMLSGGILFSLIFVLVWGIISCLLGFFKIYFIVEIGYIVAYALVSYMICHLLVFRKGKYLKYFKKLDSRSRSEKWNYALITLLFVIISIAIWLYSFRFSPKL